MLAGRLEPAAPVAIVVDLTALPAHRVAVATPLLLATFRHAYFRLTADRERYNLRFYLSVTLP
jgi:hypothetical protein